MNTDLSFIKHFQFMAGKHLDEEEWNKCVIRLQSSLKQNWQTYRCDRFLTKTTILKIEKFQGNR